MNTFRQPAFPTANTTAFSVKSAPPKEPRPIVAIAIIAILIA